MFSSRLGLTIAGLLAFSGAVPSYAGFDEGIAAAKRGDYVTAFEHFTPEAQSGNPVAQFLVGFAYEGGQGVAKDEAEAIKWYRKAADQGHREAQFRLGSMYALGTGTVKNGPEAIKWLQRAAEHGHVEAQFLLGAMFTTGNAVPKDTATGTAWLEKAAAQGHAKAKRLLEIEKQISIIDDKSRAVDKGLDRVRGSIDEVDKSLKDVQEDTEELLREKIDLLNRSHELNRRLHGSVSDNPEGFSDWRELASKGHASSQLNVGAMYALGRGVQKNVASAISWFVKAAEAGNTTAQYNLGMMNVQLRDYVGAYKWTLVASRRAENKELRDRAEANLRRLSRALSAADRSKAEQLAREWLAQRKAVPTANLHTDIEVAFVPFPPGTGTPGTQGSETSRSTRNQSQGEAVSRRGVADTLEGVYNARGTNPNGSQYTGTCRVTNIGENRYRFEWSVGGSYRGIGTLVGNTLTVDWGSEAPIIYKVQADGTLVGTWANGRASETLRPAG